jgi:hypothetical protein
LQRPTAMKSHWRQKLSTFFPALMSMLLLWTAAKDAQPER